MKKLIRRGRASDRHEKACGQQEPSQDGIRGQMNTVFQKEGDELCANC